MLFVVIWRRLGSRHLSPFDVISRWTLEYIDHRERVNKSCLFGWFSFAYVFIIWTRLKLNKNAAYSTSFLDPFLKVDMHGSTCPRWNRAFGLPAIESARTIITKNKTTNSKTYKATLTVMRLTRNVLNRTKVQFDLAFGIINSICKVTILRRVIG